MSWSIKLLNASRNKYIYIYQPILYIQKYTLEDTRTYKK